MNLIAYTEWKKPELLYVSIYMDFKKVKLIYYDRNQKSGYCGIVGWIVSPPKDMLKS